MLLQQIFPVVVPVWCSHGGVDVILGRCTASAEGNGALVVELDQDNGAVNTVVEDRVFVHLADPGEARAVEVFLNLCHFHFGMAFFEIMNPESG